MAKLKALHCELDQSAAARGATNLQLNPHWIIRAVMDRNEGSKGVLQTLQHTTTTANNMTNMSFGHQARISDQLCRLLERRKGVVLIIIHFRNEF